MLVNRSSWEPSMFNCQTVQKHTSFENIVSKREIAHYEFISFMKDVYVCFCVRCFQKFLLQMYCIGKRVNKLLLILFPVGTSKVQKSLTHTNKLHPLIGSDCPHVYENKIKRQQHRAIKNDAKNMTSAETVEFKKRREEQIRALEVAKERTKNILNQQVDSSIE